MIKANGGWILYFALAERRSDLNPEIERIDVRLCAGAGLGR